MIHHQHHRIFLSSFVKLTRRPSTTHSFTPAWKRRMASAVSSQTSVPTTTTTTTTNATTTQYRNNADLIVDLSLDVTSSNVNDQIWNIVRKICPFLVNHVKQDTSTGSLEGVTIKPLTGGLSNELFVVQTSHRQGVLVRIHPSTENDNNDNNSSSSSNSKDEHAVVDREVENRLAAWLSSQGIGPIYYGRFINGRVEEFYPNVTPLSFSEMPNYALQIAAHLANLHRLQAPNEIMIKPTNYSSSSHWVTVDRWFNSVNQLQNRKSSSSSSSSKSSPAQVEEELQLVKDLSHEWIWLKKQLSEISPSSSLTTKVDASELEIQALEFFREIVLTHQDCQSLNVLKDCSSSSSSNISSNNDVKLIDFEYSGWNPRAADIANTFCEYCDMNNLRAQYETEFPSINDQNVFLKAYISQSQPQWASELLLSPPTTTTTTPSQWESVLKIGRKEVGRFTLQSHIGWAIWSILKSKEDSIEFDYIAYAQHRMEGYRLFKAQYFS